MEKILTVFCYIIIGGIVITFLSNIFGIFAELFMAIKSVAKGEKTSGDYPDPKGPHGF